MSIHFAPQHAPDAYRYVAPFGHFLRVSVVATALSLIAAGPAIPLAAAEKSQVALKAEIREDGIAISEGERPVLFYQRAPKSMNGRYERSNYIHPLYDLDGQVLTEDFPKDHLHQRGIYWAWHQTWIGDKKLGDGWAIRDFSWQVTKVDATHPSDDAVRCHAEVLWKSPSWRNEQGEVRPLVREQTQITVHREQDDARAIDFRIELLALEPNLRIGGSEDEKGYSGFSARLRLPDDVRFIGQDGDVEPAFGAVAAGPWIDILASFAPDKRSGLAILCHPTLPGFPQPWVLRSSRSMQNPAWPGRDAVVLSHETPLVLRYRLIVHRGEVPREKLAQWQAEYAKQAD